MNKAGGFITLHRQILNWEWYNDLNTFRLFVHLLLTVNFKDGRFEGRKIRRGQIVTSLSQLATSAGLSIQQTKTALKHLILTGEITNESCAQHRIITVVKYDDYQQLTKEPTNDQQTTNKQSNKQPTSDLTNDQQQYNNDNNNNKVKKETMEQKSVSASRFNQPTKEEIFDFCMDNNLGLNVDKFYNHYESNGWMVGNNKIKDWKAAVRYWVSNDKEQPAKQTQAPVKKVIAQEYTQRDYSDEDADAFKRMLASAGWGTGG